VGFQPQNLPGTNGGGRGTWEPRRGELLQTRKNFRCLGSARKEFTVLQRIKGFWSTKEKGNVVKGIKRRICGKYSNQGCGKKSYGVEGAHEKKGRYQGPPFVKESRPGKSPS